MENAVKALLIAGGILLGIIIISAGVSFYSNLNSDSKEYISKSEEINLQTFNSRFEKFQGRQDVKPQEIVSIYNYIEENKDKVPESVILQVGNKNLAFSDEDAKIKYIRQTTLEYKCDGLEYIDGQISKIIFSAKI